MAEAEDTQKTAPEAAVQQPRWRATFHSLGARDYRLFWLATLASFSAVQMEVVARGWLVYKLGGSALDMAYVTAAWGAAVVVFSPFAGVVVERSGKRDLLAWTQLGLGLIALVIAVLISMEMVRMWHLMVVSLLSGAIFTFSMPGRQTFIPELVGREQITNAVALASGGMNLTRVAAPALAGVLLPAIGFAGVYYLMVGCYFASVAFMLMVSTRGEPLAKRTQNSVRHDLAEGMAYVRGNKVLLMLLVAAAFPTFFGMPYIVLMPIFAGDVLQVGESGLGAMMAAVGVGAVLGSLFVASLGGFKRKGFLLIGAAFFFGVALLLFAWSQSFYLALVFLPGVGFGFASYMALNNTLMLTNTPAELRGRVMSFWSMTIASYPLGVLLTGAMAHAWGVPAAVMIDGGALALFAVVLVITQPRVRRLG